MNSAEPLRRSSPCLELEGMGLGGGKGREYGVSRPLAELTKPLIGCRDWELHLGNSVLDFAYRPCARAPPVFLVISSGWPFLKGSQ